VPGAAGESARRRRRRAKIGTAAPTSASNDATPPAETSTARPSRSIPLKACGSPARRTSHGAASTAGGARTGAAPAKARSGSRASAARRHQSSSPGRSWAARLRSAIASPSAWPWRRPRPALAPPSAARGSSDRRRSAGASSSYQPTRAASRSACWTRARRSGSPSRRARRRALAIPVASAFHAPHEGRASPESAWKSESSTRPSVAQAERTWRARVRWSYSSRRRPVSTTWRGVSARSSAAL